MARRTNTHHHDLASISQIIDAHEITNYVDINIDEFNENIQSNLTPIPFNNQSIGYSLDELKLGLHDYLRESSTSHTIDFQLGFIMSDEHYDKGLSLILSLIADQIIQDLEK